LINQYKGIEIKDGHREFMEKVYTAQLKEMYGLLTALKQESKEFGLDPEKIWAEEEEESLKRKLQEAEQETSLKRKPQETDGESLEEVKKLKPADASATTALPVSKQTMLS